MTLGEDGYTPRWGGVSRRGRYKRPQKSARTLILRLSALASSCKFRRERHGNVQEKWHTIDTAAFAGCSLSCLSC